LEAELEDIEEIMEGIIAEVEDDSVEEELVVVDNNK
jgi:hypothetical protein